ncbi:unnamed protein product [marine sediment metagenome]|uniref:Uncharacterized protein n=1 Tax=marine sediment metagenome TaxID=412755 RepID=X0YMB0_9ZZZZ
MIRSKKLKYALVGFVVLLFAGIVLGAVFSSFVTWTGTYEVDTPLIQYGPTATGPWEIAEDFEVDLGTNTGTAISMGYTETFFLAVAGAVTVAFDDSGSTEGLTINVYLASDLVTPITSYEFVGSATTEFYLEVLVSPMTTTGTVLTASLVMDANGL